MTTHSLMAPVADALDGPAWARKGLDQREGRYPLAVEAPVLAMVATLVPGVSTLTQFARYYALYWALADLASRRELDAAACRQLLRRSEVLIAQATRRDSGTDVGAHGEDALARGLSAGSLWDLAELGEKSYSPRAWGFWSQYGGPSEALGTVTVDEGALRPGRQPCPDSVRSSFAPLFEAASLPHPPAADALPAELATFSLGRAATADLGELAEIFTASRDGRHDPSEWTGEDRTRRATLRVVLRCRQFRPENKPLDALRNGVAFGATLVEDRVLASEDRAAGWRGLLLRHYSVGAWRRIWAALVDEVKSRDVSTQADLHDWISGGLPVGRVGSWLDGLPNSVDAQGHPAPAEQLIVDSGKGPSADLKVLALGAGRLDTLGGLAGVAFRGGRNTRPTYLGPEWVARRIADHRDRTVAELGRTVVDDMLAQARRVAYRKVQVRSGRLQVFSRLHERNGTYTARSREGSGNVGTRIEQLSGISSQLGLVDASITDRGAHLLGITS